MEFDLSTIDQENLSKKFPKMTIRRGCHLSSSFGSACFGEPPGFPSYFLQDIYTESGNQPRTGSTLVLLGYEIENTDGKSKRHRLKDVYHKLPLKHERVQLWIKHTMYHFKNCYIDDKYELDGKDKLFIYPVPFYKLPVLKTVKNDFFDSQDETIAIPVSNQDTGKPEQLTIEEKAKSLATLDNHAGVRQIREFYPEFEPTEENIKTPIARPQEDWWEKYAYQPSEEECPGHLRTKHGEFDTCGMCGRTNIKKLSTV